MFDVREKSPYAGVTVKIKPGVCDGRGAPLDGCDFTIEDWWQNVGGSSWKTATGVLAVNNYAFRIGGTKVPTDDEVLYGKIGPFGYLFHVSELCLPEVT